jgi:hypothetical protein
MRKSFCIALFILLGLNACRNGEVRQVVPPMGDNAVSSVGARDTSWLVEFRDLRDALYRRDKQRVKKYFQFPVVAKGNGIWSLALPEGQRMTDPGEPDKVVPFTERDFDRYFSTLFPPELLNGLLKVKTAGFASDQVFATEILSKDTISYTLLCNVDSANTGLNFILNVQFGHKDNEGNADDDSSESSIGYFFEILDGKHIRFKEVLLAG